MFNKSLFSMLILFVSFALFIGCNESDSSNPMEGVTGQAGLRVLHTSYDAPDVDIKLDGSIAISSLGYGSSSGYANLSSGSYDVAVTPAGASSPVVIDAMVTLEDGKDYTVIAAGPLSQIAPVIAVDKREAVPDMAKIRFAHMSPDAPAVDIKLNSGNGATVFANAAFKDVAEYTLVDGGSYTFAVTPANSTTEVITFDPVTVENGMVYTVVAHGTLDDMDNYPFAARVFIDNDPGDGYADLTAFGSANVMVIHASPDAPGVDLLVDDKIAGSNLQFPGNTGYLPVTATTHNIKVNVAGTATTVIEADLDFMRDKSYSAFAVDTVATISPLVLEDNLSAPAAGYAHVRFIHLSPNAPAVDITTTDGTVVFGNKAFKEYTDFTPLPAGTYDLEVRLQGTNTVVLPLNGITLEDGKIYTVFAKGLVNGDGAQALGAQIIVNN